MIVDASALLAIVLHEDDAARYETALANATTGPFLSPVNYLEAHMRASSAIGESCADVLDDLMEAARIVIEAVTPEQARIAREAFDRYGKGRHPARLNLGDCFAYALARSRQMPLLFKGDDFRQTDIRPAL